MSLLYSIDIRCDWCQHRMNGVSGSRRDPNFSEREIRCRLRRSGWTTKRTSGHKLDLCHQCSQAAGLPIRHSLRKLKGGVG